MTSMPKMPDVDFSIVPPNSDLSMTPPSQIPLTSMPQMPQLPQIPAQIVSAGERVTVTGDSERRRGRLRGQEFGPPAPSQTRSVVDRGVRLGPLAPAPRTEASVNWLTVPPGPDRRQPHPQGPDESHCHTHVGFQDRAYSSASGPEGTRYSPARQAAAAPPGSGASWGLRWTKR